MAPFVAYLTHLLLIRLEPGNSMKNTSPTQAQIVYFGHGGGPLPLLGDPGHRSMIDFMTRLPVDLTRPEAILVISAHWEERQATLLGAKNPTMFYDYYGFPEKAYQVQYPAPGNPELAHRMAAALQQNGMAAQIDPERGFDHGVFIPLMLIYPEADIPCTQLSLLRGLNPAAHIALGQALREFMNEKLLVIGSGFSYHNMRGFSWDNIGAPDPANDAFQDWLIETCSGPLAPEEREQRLVEWEKAPSARDCHPREEHLLPLQVCQGMAGGPAKLIYDDKILGKRNVGFLWG
jgi:aromatic ring-opening dioxygenase catalytic subunit (LigB family)